MNFRTYHDVAGEDRSRLMEQVTAQRRRVSERLASVRRVVAVVSGKGGVGKSFVTAALARGASGRGLRVGVLDADLRSPTVARLLNVSGPLDVDQDGVVPAVGDAGVRVMSTDLLLDEGQPLRWREPSSERFVWRGALEVGTLREFLSDTQWGELDLLLLDLPPGADGVVDVSELVENLAGLLAITIPSDESRRSVERTVRSARDAGIAVLGLVENMSGYACPECGATKPLFEGTAGSELAEEFGVPLLGQIPFSPAPSATRPLDHSAVSAQVLDRILEAIP